MKQSWKRADLSDSDIWERKVTPDEAVAFRTFVDESNGLKLGSPEDYVNFPVLEGASGLLDDVRDRLVDGPGFVVVTGIPIAGYTDEQCQKLFWGIGNRLGTPVTQNAERELMGHVYDKGREGSDLNYRGFATRLGSPFHVDLSDVVGLMCVRAAKTGGQTQLVSSLAIHDIIKAERPDLLKVLERGFYWDRRGEEGPGELPRTQERIPVFSYKDDLVSCRMHRGFINWWVKRSGEAPTAEETEAMDLFEQICFREGMMHETYLAPGDILFVNNYTVLHARTEFEDWPEPGRGRYLLRLWIEMDGIREIKDEPVMRYGVITHGDLGMRPVELAAGARSRG